MPKQKLKFIWLIQEDFNEKLSGYDDENRKSLPQTAKLLNLQVLLKTLLVEQTMEGVS